MKKIALGVAGFIAIVLLYFFGPALLDRIIGLADRSIKGTFKENCYTYKLSEKSDILPFTITLLPDTDISKKYIHAIIGFHYYPIMDQDPTENRYYEFIDDGSLTISNNLLITEIINKNEDDYYTCRKSSASYGLFYNRGEDESHYFGLDYKEKKQTSLYSGYGVTEPIALDNDIYWLETKEVDDEHEVSTLVCLNPETNNRENLITREGTLELMDSDNQSLLYLWLNYEDDNDLEMLCRYNIKTNKIDSISIADYGSYIIDAYLDDNIVYFPLFFDEYEENPLIGRVGFNPNNALEFIKIPQYSNSEFVQCKIGGGYAVITYNQKTRRSTPNSFAVILSLNTGKEVKKIEDISNIGINSRYIFYTIKKLNRMGFIESAEIAVEELSSLQ